MALVDGGKRLMRPPLSETQWPCGSAKANAGAGHWGSVLP